jgi:hypothetical protein
MRQVNAARRLSTSNLTITASAFVGTNPESAANLWMPSLRLAICDEAGPLLPF